MAQCREIAEAKMPDLNAELMWTDASMMIGGSARAMVLRWRANHGQNGKTGSPRAMIISTGTAFTRLTKR